MIRSLPCRSTGGGLTAAATPTDAELLAQWRAERSPTVLEQLVRRHGGMVLGVCQRALGHTPDADDAFQATFLILVRKADRLIRPGQVAGWLYGVALRIARRVKTDRARRRRREETMIIDPPAPIPPDDTAEIRWILDEELDRLPEKYRLPIVLCELEERTLDEAARELGWPKGTVAGRLSRGRDLLRRRLSRRRGLELAPMVMLGGVLAPTAASAAQPHDTLVKTTVHMASQPNGPTGHSATALAYAIDRHTATRRWKLVLALLVVFLLSFTAGCPVVSALAANPSGIPHPGGCH